MGCLSGQCDTSFAQLSDLSCYSCPTNCKACTYTKASSWTKCSTCLDRFVKNSADSSCNACPSSCAKCTWQTSQSVCNIQQCDDGYVQNPNDKTCVACPSGCSNCFYDTTSSGAKCYTGACNMNFMSVLTGAVGTCSNCISNCKHCSDTTTCFDQKCADGYGLKFSDRLCYACSDGCKNCDIATDSTSTCTACKSGFAMKSDTKTCVACPENCLSCTYDTGISKTKCNDNQCKSGYTQNPSDSQKKCVKCNTCTSCTFDSANPDTPKCVAGTCPAKQAVKDSDFQCGSE